jgi:hypothetical protein
MHRRSIRRAWAPVLAVLLASTVLVGPATPASAATGTYVVSRQDGVAFQLLTTRNLLLGTTDDQLFRVGTFLSGVNHMPFPVRIYGTKFTSMTISSNGNIQLGVCCSGGTAAFTNTSLPTSTFGKAALAVFWDDLFFAPDDPSHFFKEGIFTKTSGVAPHRKYLISWQGHSFSSESYFALAQVLFTEGSQTIRFRYGASDLQGAFNPSETIGVQGPGGSAAPATLVAFNPSPPAVVAGRQYTFQHVG